MPHPPALPLLLLVVLTGPGCGVDNGLTAKDGGEPGADTAPPADSGMDTDTAPPIPDEACNGVDDDGDGLVDEGFPDADGNGRADCLDGECPPLTLGAAGTVAIAAACAASSTSPPPVVDPWRVRVQWQVAAPSVDAGYVHSYHAALVGNLDDDNGDGVVDARDVPEVVVNAHDGEHAMLLVLDGATGAEKWFYDGVGIGAGVAIADVDGDGWPDVVSANEAGYALALDHTGARLWRATTAPTSTWFTLLTVADLEGDGVAEVIVDDLVLDGRTGAVRFSLAAPPGAPFRIAAVADLDRDGDQEVLFAGAAYDSDGAPLWSTGETGPYGFWPVVVQADADPEAEIGFVGDRWTLWEDDGTPLASTSYGQAQPGPPCVGDFDGDGAPEVAWPAYRALTVSELDGTRAWQAPIDDASGLAGCSGYDVDGDGALEVLYADESTFAIYDGASGATRFVDTAHTSTTLTEYPTVADVDHDGHAEILVTGDDATGATPLLTVYEHDGDGWPAAGPTWGLHDFAVSNLDVDGSVPPAPDPYWSRYGVYRARPAADDPARADLVAEVTDACVYDCTYGPVALAVRVYNQGGLDVAAGATLAVYANDGSALRAVAVVTLPAIAAGEILPGIELPLTPDDVGRDGFRVVVDDDGTGAGIVAECDESNNADDFADVWCP